MSFVTPKQDSFIAGTDKDSGMQRATVNGTIGNALAAAGVNVAGASIGGTEQADYHISAEWQA